MIAFPSSVQVWLAVGRTDMRLGMNGCWKRVICPLFPARELSGMFVTCSVGGTCVFSWLCGVFS